MLTIKSSICNFTIPRINSVVRRIVYTYSFTRIKSFTESTRTRVYLSPVPFFPLAVLFFNENSHNVKRAGGILSPSSPVSIETERRAFCVGHTSSRGDFQFAIKRRSICNLMEGSRIWIGALCTIHSPIFLPFVSLNVLPSTF